MDVDRTTIPDVGTVHHFRTRGGQRFGVMVDRSDRRLLLIYDPVDPSDPDVPKQRIVMEQDEADQVAEILHSRPVLDRLAEVERRLDELTQATQAAARPARPGWAETAGRRRDTRDTKAVAARRAGDGAMGRSATG